MQLTASKEPHKMAQSTVMPFNLSDLMQSMSSNLNISEFSGRNEEDPIKWIAQYERVTRLWTDAGRVEQVVYYLDGTAKYWYKQAVANKPTTFADFKKQFLLQFTQTEEREFAIRKLKQMVYDPTLHRVSNFITDFIHWTNIVHPDYDEKKQIRDLFERFSSTFQRKFHLSTTLDDVKTLKVFTDVALRIEKGMKLKQLEQNTLMQASVRQANDARDDILKELLLEIKSIKSDVSELKKENNQNKVKKAKQCFKCGESWPECGCVSKCRECSGKYPACGCGKRKVAKQIEKPGN